MTELSSFWFGTGVGDAPADDNSSQEYSDIFSKFLGSHYAAGYVFPGYGTNLRVQANSPAAMNVILKSGAALVQGRIYENTADNTLTIAAADVTNPRLDRVVIQITFSDTTGQTIRAVVLTGTPAATPSLPALTQNATTYEVPLFYIWVAASATTIGDESIHDERTFAHNFEDQFFSESILRHAEFLAPISTSRIYPPAAWTTVGTITGIVTDTKPSQQPRGNSIKITAGAASSGIQQINPVLPSSRYTFRVLTKVTAGDVGKIVITTNAASPGTITREVRRTGVWLEEIISYNTEADATTMTVQLEAANNTDIVWYGQSLLVNGYITGPYKPINYGQEVLIDNFTITSNSTLTLGIPQDLPYKNIRILISSRSSNNPGVNVSISISLTFNGDSGSNYDSIFLEQSHSGSKATGEGLASTSIIAARDPSDFAPANVFGSTEFIISDYKGSNHKAVLGESAAKLAASTGNLLILRGSGWWRNTAAITTIDIANNTNFLSGSSVSVYLFN
jgi:hypothetical protein